MEKTSVFHEKNVSKAIFRMALPAMLGQITTLIYNIADTYFISFTRDSNQIAAVTLCTPVLLILMSLGAIFGSGGSSLIARYLGGHRERDASDVSSFCFYTSNLLSIVILVLGLMLSKSIAGVLGANQNNLSFTLDYLRYIFIGAPFIMLGNSMVHIFRSVGMANKATIGLMLGNGTNIVLDYILIVLLHMGTAGAAIATALGFVVNSLYFIFSMITYTQKGGTLLPLAPSHYHPTPLMIRKVFAIGIPGAMITVLMSVANIVLNNYIAIYGSNPVASYGIAYKINMLPIMLSVGLAQGIAPLIGYYCGSGDATKLKRTMGLSILYGLILGGLFIGLFFAAGTTISGIFFKDAALMEQTARFLHILCISAPVVSIINIVTTYYQATGKAAPSLFITISRNAILFIPAIILLNHFFGLIGVIAATPVIEYLMSVICVIMFLFFA